MTTTKTWIKRTDRNPTPDDTSDNGTIGVWRPGMTFMAYSRLDEFLMSKDLTHFYPLEKSPPVPVVEKSLEEQWLDHWQHYTWAPGTMANTRGALKKGVDLGKRSLSAECLDLFSNGSLDLQWIAEGLEKQSYFDKANRLRLLGELLINNCTTS